MLSHRQTTGHDSEGVVRGTIRVAVRVRPFLPRELSSNSLLKQANVGHTAEQSAVHCLPDSVIVNPVGAARHSTSRYYGMKGNVRMTKRYEFDTVHGPRATQHEVYANSVKRIVMDVFHGRNGSVLAYGATGSGKTHTMLGDLQNGNPGIVFLAMKDLLGHRAALEDVGQKVVIRVAHYEVYNEVVFDLLVPQPRHAHSEPADGQREKRRIALQVQETSDGAAELPQITWHVVESLEHFENLMHLSGVNRVVAETSANDTSSRSHAILTVEIDVRPDEQALTGTTARLKLCDLAGSERAASNHNNKIVFKEGANINKSLLALGSVVQALANQKKGFVPYRGSKLTRLLKDCLGGNCNTVMMVCITQHPAMVDETNNTLQYAMYAKKIEVCAKTNTFRQAEDSMRAQLQVVIDRQQEEIEALKEEIRLGGHGRGLSAYHTSPRVRHSTTTLGSTDAATQCASDTSTPTELECAVKELEAAYKNLLRKRLALLDDLRNVDEPIDETLRVKLRALKLSLAIHMAQNGGQSGSALADGEATTTKRGSVHPPPSKDVALQQHFISAKLKQIADNEIKRRQITAALSEVDGEIRALYDMIGVREMETVNELLFRSCTLKASSVEAEIVATGAAETQSAQLGQTIAELKMALEKCTAVVRGVAAAHNVGDLRALQREATLALAYAQVPATATDDFAALFSAAHRTAEQSHRLPPPPAAPSVHPPRELPLAAGAGAAAGAPPQPTHVHFGNSITDCVLPEQMQILISTPPPVAKREPICSRNGTPSTASNAPDVGHAAEKRRAPTAAAVLAAQREAKRSSHHSTLSHHWAELRGKNKNANTLTSAHRDPYAFVRSLSLNSSPVPAAHGSASPPPPAATGHHKHANGHSRTSSHSLAQTVTVAPDRTLRGPTAIIDAEGFGAATTSGHHTSFHRSATTLSGTLRGVEHRGRLNTHGKENAK